MASTDLTNKISDLSVRIGEEIAALVDRVPSHETVFSAAGDRSDVIVAGAAFYVPEYTVGANQLQVFLDGVLCSNGDSYNEAEDVDVADWIEFVDDIPTTFDILVRRG